MLPPRAYARTHSIGGRRMKTRGRGAFLRRRGCARIARRICVDALVVLTIAGLIALGLSPEAPRAHGDTLVASDGFNRTETGGWGSANTGGPWTVLDAAPSWSVTPTAGGTVNAAANAGNRAILGSVTVRDVDLLSQIVLPRCGSNCDAFVVGRYNTNTYYRVGAVQGSRTQVFLRAQRSDGTFLGGDLNTAIPAAEGVVLWMRVQFQGNTPTIIRARVWKDGTPEPSTRLLNTTHQHHHTQHHHHHHDPTEPGRDRRQRYVPTHRDERVGQRRPGRMVDRRR